MANWSDPRPGATPYAQVDARSDAVDAGLRSYMLSIYNYMASGVLLTGIVALLFSQTSLIGLLYHISESGRLVGIAPLGWIVTLAPLASAKPRAVAISSSVGHSDRGAAIRTSMPSLAPMAR